MSATMPLRVFREDDTGASPPSSASALYNHHHYHRPTVSSPLSSSPTRPSSPPLTPRNPNTLFRRDIKSSPIPVPPKFKFASRPARQNPVVQKREAAQESRRRLFLRGVRQRADDRQWERRGGDQELLKLEWISLNKDLQRAKNNDVEGIVLESEIEDAVQSRDVSMPPPAHDDDPDDMIIDALEQEEEAEIDAFISSIPGREGPSSPHSLDDEDYDAIFADYFSREQNQAPESSGQMDLS